MVSAALTVLLAGSSARAGSENNVEFQIETPSLAELLQQQFVVQTICPESIDYQGIPSVMDHVDFDVGSLSWGSGMHQVDIGGGVLVDGIRPVKYQQPILIYIKSEKCMLDPDCPLDQYEAVQQVSLVFTLEAKLEKGQANLCVTYEGVFPALPQVQEALEPALEVALGKEMSICTTLDLSAVQPMIGDDFHPIATGLALDDDETRFAVRVEYGALDQQVNTAPWHAFLDGQLGPGVVGRNWSLLVGSNLARSRILERMVEGVENAPGIWLDYDDGEPEAIWTGQGGAGASIDINLWAEVDIGNPITTIGLDPISFTVPFQLDPTGEHLVANGTFDWNIANEDILATVVVATMFGDWHTTGSLLAILGVFAENYAPALPSNAAGSECTLTGEHDFSCSFPLSMPTLKLSTNAGWSPSGKLDVDGLWGFSDGLALYGDFYILGQIPQMPLQIDGSVGYGVYGGCSDMAVGYHGHVTMDSAWGRVCSATLNSSILTYHDPSASNWFEQEWDLNYLGGLTDTSQTILVPFTAMTTRGTKTINIPIKTGTSDMAQGAMARLIEQSAMCMSPQTGFLGLVGMYDPLWDIDPSPELIDVLYNEKYQTRVQDATAMLGQMTIHAGPALRTTAKLTSDSVVLVVETQLQVSLDRATQLNLTASVPVTLGTLETSRDSKAFAGRLLSDAVNNLGVMSASLLPTSVRGETVSFELLAREATR